MAPANTLKYTYCAINKLLPHRYLHRTHVFKRYLLTSKESLEKPLKYTGSDASKVTISENINLKETSTIELPYISKLICLGSFTAFMIYFCILREENDIDEMLKGNPDYQSDYALLVDLKMKLSYCKNNNLPFKKIEDKVKEIEEKLGIKSY